MKKEKDKEIDKLKKKLEEANKNFVSKEKEIEEYKKKINNLEEKKK